MQWFKFAGYWFADLAVYLISKRRERKKERERKARVDLAFLQKKKQKTSDLTKVSFPAQISIFDW